MKVKFSVNYKIKKKETIEIAKQVLFNCMVKMHELATINVPVDTSRLKTSIKFFPKTSGYKRYTLFAGVDYAIHVEFGTSPHYIPTKIKGGKKHPLADWSRRVLGDEGAAFAVAKKIARKGTEAQPFFRPALDQVKNIWIKRFWKWELK